MIKELYAKYLKLLEEMDEYNKEVKKISTKELLTNKSLREKVQKKQRELKKTYDSLEDRIHDLLHGKCLKLDNGKYLIAYADEYVTIEEVELIEE